MPTPTTLAVTCGDPGGIGPEVALKAALLQSCRVQLFGPPAVWEAAKVRGTKKLIKNAISSGNDSFDLGKDSARNGAISLAALDGAVAALKSGEAQAVVTAPVSKTSLHLAGAHYPGQTEYFAEKFSARVAMMLAGPKLRVVLTSTHLSLREAIANLSSAQIVETAQIADASLTRLLGKRPRLALAALNPHAGEGGRFGDEETKILAPAVAKVRASDIDLSGPFAADTLFWRARHGEFDAVIVLFHDQGLIPLKLLHFDDGVNVTLGLPIIRTSPDHGTAFDIAGKGVARITSMQAAMKLALRFAKAHGTAASAAK